MAIRLYLTCLLVLAGLAACGGRQDGNLSVAIMESGEDLFQTGLRLSPGAQNLRAATSSGLVALDANGDIVPSLADRWIVTDDGRSYIFRLRDGDWPDGANLTGESVRRQLQARIRSLRGTSLGLDLAPVAEVRAMAGRVVEIRLSAPVPYLLQILAQPEMTLGTGVNSRNGPMAIERDGDAALLTMKPPLERGLPNQEGWRDHVRSIRVEAMSPQKAVEAFDEGRVTVVLGGRYDTMPLADTGPLSRGTFRLDGPIGLFGMLVRREAGLLATAEGREAISMALDRPALIEPFNIGGWAGTSRIVTPGLADDPGLVEERWQDLSLDDRRALASARVSAFRREQGGASPVVLKLHLGDGAGEALLFRQLASQLGNVGILLEKVSQPTGADLVVVDSVARYAGTRWFLNQFNCSLRRGLCSVEADAFVRQANAEGNAAERDRLFALAESALIRSNVYIPFGVPLRWSLVRGTVDGFMPNQAAFHPLPPMAVLPR